MRTEITLGQGTHVCLTTPSTTKVYRALGPPAVQETSIRIGDGAILEYLPDHVIPYPGSALHQALNIEMGSKSFAILCDAVAAGRLARGEQWTFRELVSRTTITRQGRPILLDWMRLQPSARTPVELGQMEGFGYLATLALLADGFEASRDVTSALEGSLRKLPCVLGGASSISRGGCLVRLLAASAPELIRAIHDIWTLARRLLLGLPPIDVRKW